jgi:hypothetical protein
VEESVSLKVVYQDQSVNVPDGTVAVIGADTNATVRVARSGISRRHAIAKYDGSHWVVQDASSRNGTYHDGARIQLLDVTGPTRIRLGHPSEGALVELEPVAAAPARGEPKAAATKSATAAAAAAGATASTAQAPAAAKPATKPARAATTTKPVPAQAASPRPAAAPAPAHVKLAEDPRLDDLVKALNDTVHSIKGLTWSVWAMIAVTAVLAILTLFVGVVAR